MSIYALTWKRVYGAMYPPSDLAQSLLSMSGSVHLQQELVHNILLSPHFQAFPPSPEFRKQFWKWIVENLESRGEEVDERIYEAYLDILATRTSPFESRTPSPAYYSHFWSSNSPKKERLRVTTLLESRTLIEGGTTGLRTWGASFKFADWLISHPEIVARRRVLELGSGAGFLGLIIAALQLQNYEAQQDQFHLSPALTLTDVSFEVLTRCRDNFHLPCNGVGTHPSLNFCLLDWSDALDGQGDIDHLSPVADILKSADTIIGTDLVYDETIIPALVAVLALFFSLKNVQEAENDHPQADAYVTSTVRREDTVGKFLSCLSSRYLDFEELDLDARPVSQFLGRAEVGAGNNVRLIRIFPVISSS